MANVVVNPALVVDTMLGADPDSAADPISVLDPVLPLEPEPVPIVPPAVVLPAPTGRTALSKADYSVETATEVPSVPRTGT